jgi:hypothetical protein
MAAYAQNPPPAQEKPAAVITRTIDVKNADVNRIREILSAIAKATGTTLAPDQANRLIILSGSPDRVAEMESLVRRLDVPPSPSQAFSIEVAAYLLVAGEAPGVGQEVPPQLAPALMQLRSTFNYKTYKLLETVWTRNRLGGSSRASGNLPVVLADGKETVLGYNFSYASSYLTHDPKGDVIHLDGLEIETQGGRISTNIDIRPGQMVVVGKTSYDRRQALVAVLTAKIVD